MTQINNLGDATGGTLIAESQSQKATTSNTLDNLLSDATQLPLDITITGNRTLTDDEFFLSFAFNLSGSPASDFSLFLPNSGEHEFIVINNTGKVVTIDAGVSGGTVVDLRTSLVGSFHSDGTSVVATSDPDVMRYGTNAVDEDSDYFLFWDVSDGTLRRVLGSGLPGSGSTGTGAFPFKGALVTFAADLTAQDHTTAAAIGFDVEEYDTSVFHDNVTNNTRLTVPAGVLRIRLSGQAVISLIDPSDFVSLTIRKNGVIDYAGSGEMRNEISGTFTQAQVNGPVIDVIPGDFFELFLQVESDTSITIKDDQTWFLIEAIETTESGTTATVQTTDATQTVIATGAMASDSAHTIRAVVQGREDATGDTYHASLFGGARNEGGTSTAPTPNVIEVTDAGAATWDATLEANDASDEWEIKVTGEAAHTIDWTVTYFEIVQEV